MRAAAAELRRDALSGMSAAQRDNFVDLLLMVKWNLAQSEARRLIQRPQPEKK